jgi:hypothetical protein
MTADDGWTWNEPAPESLLPTVVAVHPAGVRFYSYTGLEVEKIVRHVDSYERGSYRFETDEVIIARGPGGFRF